VIGRAPPRGIADTADKIAEAVPNIAPCSGLDMFDTRFAAAAGRRNAPQAV
jgi:hypothetical protein